MLKDFSHEIGKVYGELEILDVFKLRKSSGLNSYAKCKCTICGAEGISYLSAIKRGKAKTCKRYPNRVEFCDNYVKVFIHTGETLILDNDFYIKNPNKKYYIGGKGYSVQYQSGRKVAVHRIVADVNNKNILVDHKDRDKMNCRSENLRICTVSQNGMNQGIQKNKRKTSVFKGVRVFKYKSKNSYYARIKKNGNQINIGRFDSEVEAAKAYDEKAIELFGRFACTNKSLGFL